VKLSPKSLQPWVNFALQRLSTLTTFSDRQAGSIVMQTRRITAVLMVSLAILLGFTASLTGKIAPAIADDYEKETLFAQDFSNRDLTDSSFTLSTIRQSNFQGVNLAGVSLFRAKFLEVDLTGADLRGATLDSAVFSKSNLTNANLEGAFAYHTRFEGTIVDGADFTDVLLRDDALAALCAIAKGTNPDTGRNTRETLLCDD